MNRIDTHLHLIHPDRFNYDWTTGIPALSNRAFSIDDYHAAAQNCAITGTIFVEVDVPASQSLAEADYFCQMADDPSNNILAVIASGRPENDDFESYLESIRHPRLVGMRRVLHTQPDALASDALFRKHLHVLGKEQLTFDICVLAHQLPLTTDLVDACPNTQFILDHCGGPNLSTDALDPWRTDLRELAQRPNVACKISGIIASANPATTATLRPIIEHTIDCFGWDRILFGSDWPVCNLTSNLPSWVAILDEILASTAPTDRAKLDTLNAIRIYQIQSI